MSNKSKNSWKPQTQLLICIPSPYFGFTFPRGRNHRACSRLPWSLPNNHRPWHAHIDFHSGSKWRRNAGCGNGYGDMARWQYLRLALLFRVYRFIMVHPCSPERGQRSHQAGALNPPRYRIRCRHLRFSTGARMARSHSAWCCHSGWRVGPGWQDVTWHQKFRGTWHDHDIMYHTVMISL